MNNPERWKLIRIEFIKRGIYLRDAAKAIGVSRPMISMVISGRKTSPRVRRGIAELLGISLTDLWPDHESHRAA